MAHDDDKGHGIGGGWIFLITVLLILALAAVAWVVWSRMRAQRLGLPPPSVNPFASRARNTNYPSPAPGGIKGWFETAFRNFKNRRSATGAYEATGQYSGHPDRRPRGAALDPDEAWDARVGNEADVYGAGAGGYYEEQELGMHAPAAGAYSGGGYGAPNPGLAAPYEEERGRSRSRSPAARELDQRYDEEMGRGVPRENPFGDNVERSDISMRGVSPRPIDTGARGRKSDDHESPTERRSMFRENM